MKVLSEVVDVILSVIYETRVLYETNRVIHNYM